MDTLKQIAADRVAELQTFTADLVFASKIIEAEGFREAAHVMREAAAIIDVFAAEDARKAGI